MSVARTGPADVGTIGAMSLLNARNLRRAKTLLDQNRHRVGDIVGKATEQIDKVSKGRTSEVSAKVEEAARKYSAGAASAGQPLPDQAAPSPSTAATDHRDSSSQHPDTDALDEPPG